MTCAVCVCLSTFLRVLRGRGVCSTISQDNSAPLIDNESLQGFLHHYVLVFECVRLFIYSVTYTVIVGRVYSQLECRRP